MKPIKVNLYLMITVPDACGRCQLIRSRKSSEKNDNKGCRPWLLDLFFSTYEDAVAVSQRKKDRAQKDYRFAF